MREGEAFEGAAADRRARELRADQRRAQARGRARRARGRRAARPALRDRPRSACSSWRSWASASCCSTSATTSRRCGATSSAPCSASCARGRARDRADRDAAGRRSPRPRPSSTTRCSARSTSPSPRPPSCATATSRPTRSSRWLTEPLTHRARLAGRARHPLPRADHDAARRRRVRHLVPELGRSRGCATASARPTTTPRCRGRRSRSARPKLARAGMRFLLSGGLELPTGAPRGEAYRQPPDLDDWLVLLEDYALRCLAPQRAARGRRPLRRDRRRAARARLPAHAQGHPPRHVARSTGC